MSWRPKCEMLLAWFAIATLCVAVWVVLAVGVAREFGWLPR